ncbi:SRPBCC domain-containing protein [Micromonospora sp. DT81.3]|uniref:SRPBCC domain-containing protein n=1 Tax=Actinomycetes TaxID=1760 RepID=UPI003CF1915A
MTTQKIQLAIKASPAEIWTALTSPTLSPAYYYGFEAHYGERAGETYSYVSDGKTVISGELLEVDENRKLRMTFAGTWASDVAALPDSVVTYELGDTAMALPGLTALTLTHEGLPDTVASRNVEKGWVLILSGLKTLLETGAPLVPAPAH